MRKGHSDVINRMKKADFPEKVVSEFEEMTDLSLSGIRKRMEFAYAHRTIVSEIGDAYKLVMKLTDEIELELDGKCEEFLRNRFGKTWYMYWLRMDVFLYGFGLDDIMYVRENYRKGIYSAEDCVSISMLVYPRHDDRHTCLDADSAYEIINTRREYGIQGIVEPTPYVSGYFEKLTSAEKLQAEKMLWESRQGNSLWSCYEDDYELYEQYSKMKADEAYPGITGICDMEREFLWERDRLDGLAEYLKRIYDGGDGVSATVSGSPYMVRTFCSHEGISICHIRGMRYTATIFEKPSDGPVVKFGAVYDGGKHGSTKLLLMYDGRAYTKYHSDRNFPLTLPKMSSMYRENPVMKQILDIYMDKLASDGGLVWNEIRCALAEGHVPPVVVNDILGCKSLSDMMRKSYRESRDYDWNGNNLLAGYLAMKSAHFVCGGDMEILMDYVNRTDGWEDFDICGESIEYCCRRLLAHIIASRTGTRLYAERDCGKPPWNRDFTEDGRIIMDYVGMCRETKQKIVLSVDDVGMVKHLHDIGRDRLHIKSMPAVGIPRNSVFRNLDGMLRGKGFERIKTKACLSRKGAEMYQCVSAYAENINRDESAVYSYRDAETGKQYIVEFRYEPGTHRYYVGKMTGAWDVAPEGEVLDYMESLVESGRQE